MPNAPGGIDGRGTTVTLMTLIRPDLESLPAYVPGRAIPGLRSSWPATRCRCRPPPAVLAAIAEAAAPGNRYPDLAVVGLTDAARRSCTVWTPTRIAVGCGSVSLCQQLVQVACRSPPTRWCSPGARSRRTRSSRRSAGARVVTVPLDAELRHDLDAMAAAVTPRTRLVFVCSPNNPTGTVVTAPSWSGSSTRSARTCWWRWTRPTASSSPTRRRRRADTARRHGRTWSCCARSPRRTGWPGCGWATRSAHPAVIDALRKVCAPFSVNTLAQAAAIAALDDAEAELLAPARSVGGRAGAGPRCAGGAGFTVAEPRPTSCGCRSVSGLGVRRALPERDKVIVRPFAGDGARVTVAGAEENNAFLAAARKFVSSG